MNGLCRFSLIRIFCEVDDNNYLVRASVRPRAISLVDYDRVLDVVHCGVLEDDVAREPVALFRP